MRLHSIRVFNHKSLRESPEVVLSPRMTVLVGQNNSGKSALLECMTTRLDGDARHRSATTSPDSRVEPPVARIDAELTVSGADLQAWLDRHPGGQFGFNVAPEEATELGASAFLRDVLGAARLPCRFDAGSWGTRGLLGIEPAVDDRPWVGMRSCGPGHPPGFVGTMPPGWEDLRTQLLGEFQSFGAFRLAAERLALGRGPVTAGERLASDARNLASVLHDLLARDRDRFEQVEASVRKIVPSVRRLQTPTHPSAPTTAEIVVWMDDPPRGRPDLAVPLHLCGTGVGQIVAIVAALVTSDQPRTLLIDEPNSFLHPAAVAALFELFREHPQHQYVVATHSADVIAEADPERIYRTRLKGGETQIESIEPADLRQQRRTLVDLGHRLSAVFGADRILWVEGETEEAVYPLVLRHFAPDRVRGLRILHVAETGAFEPRDAERSVRVYARVASGTALVPPTVGFLFDRERRSEEHVRRLEDTAARPVRLLKRRMLECYLLDVRAISAVLSEDDERDIPPPVIEAKLAELAADAEYGGGAATPRSSAPDLWVATVHAGRLLGAVFSGLTEARCSYDKRSHGLRLVEWLLQNDPGVLLPLAEELQAILALAGSIGVAP